MYRMALGIVFLVGCREEAPARPPAPAPTPAPSAAPAPREVAGLRLEERGRAVIVTDTKGGHRFQLPSSPKVETPQLAAPAGVKAEQVLMTLADQDPYTAVAVVRTQMAPDATLVNIYNGARDGSLRQTGGTLVSEDDTAIGGIPARHYVLRAVDSSVEVLSHGWVVANLGTSTIYIITTAGRASDDAKTKAAGQAIAASFESVTPPQVK